MRRLQERLLGSLWTPPASSQSVIWLLGVCYTISHNDSSNAPSTSGTHSDFLLDFRSRIWVTYRKGFEALGPAKLSSDVGWGCMLRSGQMLLAQALVCHHLGRHWRRNPLESNTREYLKILQCFGDSASEDCPLSIHNILAAGSPYGLVAGSWLGPYALCRSLEALAHSTREGSSNENLRSVLPMGIYVVSGDADGERGGAPCICIDDVASFCSNGDTAEWAPVLLLVPLVLGLDKINPRYLPSLAATFGFPQSLGIAGGKPGASTYLVGVQDDQAFYLDPHEVQQAFTVSPDAMDVDTSSYHCSDVRQMPLNAIDPSLALGFYCRNQGLVDPFAFDILNHKLGGVDITLRSFFGGFKVSNVFYLHVGEFEDLCKRASDLAMESNGAPMFTVVKSSNKGLRKQSSLAMKDESSHKEEIFTLDEVLPSDEGSDGWQFL